MTLRNQTKPGMVNMMSAHKSKPKSKQGNPSVNASGRQNRYESDIEIARSYFWNGIVETFDGGRIRWRRSTLFPALLSHQDNNCYWCRNKMDSTDYRMVDSVFRPGTNYPSFEHLISLRSGGRDQPSNLVLAHFSCNLRRDKKGGRFMCAEIISNRLRGLNIDWT